MAVNRTGSVNYVGDTQAISGSRTISVPADADFLIVAFAVWHEFTDAVLSGGTVTIGGQTMQCLFAADASHSYDLTGLFGIANPPTGSQTLSWDFASSSNFGDCLNTYYAGYTGVDPDNPVRGSGGEQTSSSSASSGAMQAQAGDLALAVAHSDISALNWTGATEIRQDLPSGYTYSYCAYAENDSLSGSITNTETDASWACMSAVVLAAAASGENYTGIAQISGGGSLSIQGRSARSTGLDVSGAGAISFLGRKSIAGGILLSGGGALGIAARSARSGELNITSPGDIIASGTHGGSGAIQISGNGSLSALGRSDRSASLDVSGAGAIGALGRKSIAGGILLSGGGTLGISARSARSGELTISGAGEIIISGIGGGAGAGTIRISGGGSLSIQGRSARSAGLAISGAGAIGVHGRKSVPASILISGGGTLGITARSARSGELTISGAGTILVAGVQGAPSQVIDRIILLGGFEIQENLSGDFGRAVRLEGGFDHIVRLRGDI